MFSETLLFGLFINVIQCLYYLVFGSTKPSLEPVHLGRNGLIDLPFCIVQCSAIRVVLLHSLHESITIVKTGILEQWVMRFSQRIGDSRLDQNTE